MPSSAVFCSFSLSSQLSTPSPSSQSFFLLVLFHPPNISLFSIFPFSFCWFSIISSFSGSGRDMKRHHGFHGILPGDWPRHPEPHHPGRQLCHPAPGLPHLLHPVRLPGKRPHQGVRTRQHTGTAQPVAHTSGGHAELACLVPLRAQQHGGPRRAADARPEPGQRREREGARKGKGEGEEEYSGLRKRRRKKKRDNHEVLLYHFVQCF